MDVSCSYLGSAWREFILLPRPLRAQVANVSAVVFCIPYSSTSCPYRPSTPQNEEGEPVWPTFDGLSDGAQTSGFNTPDVSRPATPEELPNIPAGERDGLPLPSSSKRGRTFTREAAKLVAVHKAKTMFKSKKKQPSHKPGESSSSAGPSADSKASSETLRHGRRASREAELPADLRKAAPTGGVLSALLKLYEQPHSERSSQATLVPSTASTPPESMAAFTKPVQGGGTHRAPEELAVPLSFADEVHRRGNLQLNSMLDSLNAQSNGAPASSRQNQPAKHADGILGALHQSNAILTGAASPISSGAMAPPKRPESGLK